MWRRRKQDDFHAEIDAHLQIEADRLRESGLTQRDAEAAARRTFGNATLTLERFYESSRWQWWGSLEAGRSLRVPFDGARAAADVERSWGRWRLASAPARSCSACLRAVVLRPLPYDQPASTGSVVGQCGSARRRLGRRSPIFATGENENRVFSQMAAYRYSLLTVAGGCSRARLGPRPGSNRSVVRSLGSEADARPHVPAG